MRTTFFRKWAGNGLKKKTNSMKNIIIIFLFFSKVCSAQRPFDSSTFRHGVYLENFKVTLPWLVKFSEIGKYGNPRIVQTKKRSKTIFIIWDSIVILNGTKANLKILVRRSQMDKSVLAPLGYCIFSIDQTGFVNTVSYFKTYQKLEGSFKKRKNIKSFMWTINNCRVYVVGDMKKNKYFIYLRQN